MDDEYARAVLEVFVRLYRKGYIFRDNRIVNWCPRCRPAISDLEVRAQRGRRHAVLGALRVEGGDEHVTVATVRPETILADTGVAVHPDDERYSTWSGDRDRADRRAARCRSWPTSTSKSDFGTGALKITPGHDPNDFEIGRRHGLAELVGDRLRRHA